LLSRGVSVFLRHPSRLRDGVRSMRRREAVEVEIHSSLPSSSFLRTAAPGPLAFPDRPGAKDQEGGPTRWLLYVGRGISFRHALSRSEA
jgi:hypothetical protein